MARNKVRGRRRTRSRRSSEVTDSGTKTATKANAPVVNQSHFDRTIAGLSLIALTAVISICIIRAFKIDNLAVKIAIAALTFTVISGLINLLYKQKLENIRLTRRARKFLATAILLFSGISLFLHVTTPKPSEPLAFNPVLKTIGLATKRGFDDSSLRDISLEPGHYNIYNLGFVLENGTGDSLTVIGASMRIDNKEYDLNFYSTGQCASEPFFLLPGDRKYIMVATDIDPSNLKKIVELGSIPSIVVNDSTGRKWPTVSEDASWDVAPQLNRFTQQTFIECIRAK